MIVCSLIVMSARLTPASGFGLDTLLAIATGSVSRMILRRTGSAPVPSSRYGADLPIVDRLVQRQHYEIQVFENRPFLDLVPEEHAHGVVERVEHALEHQLVLPLRPDHEEREVDRRLVKNEVLLVQQDIPCSLA